MKHQCADKQADDRLQHTEERGGSRPQTGNSQTNRKDSTAEHGADQSTEHPVRGDDRIDILCEQAHNQVDQNGEQINIKGQRHLREAPYGPSVVGNQEKTVGYAGEQGKQDACQRSPPSNAGEQEQSAQREQDSAGLKWSKPLPKEQSHGEADYGRKQEMDH